MKLKTLGAVSVLSLGLLNCGPADAPDQFDPSEPTGKAEAAEEIDAQNDPNRFALSFTRQFTDLGLEGESTRKPFASNWWPMSRGGINYRWQGSSEPSPADKYDLLVHPDRVREIELTLAKKNYKDEPVNEDAQPETFTLGPAAEWEMKEHGRYGDTDPEGWWGHCNGWASYVINEDEPIRSVWVRYDSSASRVTECDAANRDGCTRFDLGDINAIGAELYWHDGARMLGRRCEEASSDFEFDESGRINKVECRDGNAASLHLVATNMLGRLERPFIVDLTADRQVWNYPVYKYRLDRNEEITLEEALAEIGAPEGTTTWIYNEDAKRFARVQLKLWIVEDSIPPSAEPAGHLLDRYTTIENYDYILEMDTNGVIVGGEFVGNSKTRHPDFLWYSYSNSYYSFGDDLSDGDNREIRFSIWKQILTLAQAEPPPPPPPEGALRVSATPNLAIPDNDPTGVRSDIDVTESFTADKVVARVHIRHSYRGDLVVRLEHGSQSVTLHNAEGGSADDLTLEAEVAELAGTEASGSWTLHVVDRASADTGLIVSWGLDLYRGEGGGGGGTGGDHTYSLNPNASIPDNNQSGVRSSLNVSDDFSISTVSVTLDITHTYRGDLQVELLHGTQRATLHDRSGGSTDNLKGTFEATGFSGSASGEWVLVVRDLAGQDVGNLVSWTLTIAEGSGGGGGGTSVSREYEESPALAIPDNAAAGVASTIEVTDEIAIQDISIELDITHTYIGDLKVVIEKDGVTQTIHANDGGGADNIQRTFETRAFRNMNARGTWTLRVIDSAAQDVGTLNRWKLIVSGTES